MPLFLFYLHAKVNRQMRGTVRAVVKRLAELTASCQWHCVKTAPVPWSSQREAEPGNAKVTCPCYPSARSTSHLLDQTVCLLQSGFLDHAMFVFKARWICIAIKLACLLIQIYTL